MICETISPDISGLIFTADPDVNDYLRSEFLNLLNNPNLSDWIDGHVDRGSPPATDLIIDESEKFTA